MKKVVKVYKSLYNPAEIIFEIECQIKTETYCIDNGKLLKIRNMTEEALLSIGYYLYSSHRLRETLDNYVKSKFPELLL